MQTGIPIAAGYLDCLRGCQSTADRSDPTPTMRWEDRRRCKSRRRCLLRCYTNLPGPPSVGKVSVGPSNGFERTALLSLARPSRFPRKLSAVTACTSILTPRSATVFYGLPPHRGKLPSPHGNPSRVGTEGARQTVRGDCNQLFIVIQRQTVTRC